MFKGSLAYDANAFKAAAETIGSHSGERLSSLFDRSTGAPGSKASANVESERPKFDKPGADLASMPPRSRRRQSAIRMFSALRYACRLETR